MFNTPYGAGLLDQPQEVQAALDNNTNTVAQQIIDMLSNRKGWKRDFTRAVAKRLITLCDNQDATEIENSRREFIKTQGIRKYSNRGELIEDDKADGTIIDNPDDYAKEREEWNNLTW